MLFLSHGKLDGTVHSRFTPLMMTHKFVGGRTNTWMKWLSPSLSKVQQFFQYQILGIVSTNAGLSLAYPCVVYLFLSIIPFFGLIMNCFACISSHVSISCVYVFVAFMFLILFIHVTLLLSFWHVIFLSQLKKLFSWLTVSFPVSYVFALSILLWLLLRGKEEVS